MRRSQITIWYEIFSLKCNFIFIWRPFYASKVASWEGMVNGKEDRGHPSIPSMQSTLGQSGHGSLDDPRCCMQLVSWSHKAQLLFSSTVSYQPFLPHSGTTFFPIFSQTSQRCHQITTLGTGREVELWQENKEWKLTGRAKRTPCFSCPRYLWLQCKQPWLKWDMGY